MKTADNINNSKEKETVSFSITPSGLFLLLTSLLLYGFGYLIDVEILQIFGLVPMFIFLYFLYQTYMQKHEKVIIETTSLSPHVKAKGFYLLNVKVYKKKLSKNKIRGFLSIKTSEGLFPITPINAYVEFTDQVTKNFLFYAPKRGKEKIIKLTFQENGLFNFFTIRHVIQVNEEIFVLPENQRISLPWTVKQKIMEQLISEVSIPVRGRGTDFLALKEFEYGDEIRHIHWKATAKFKKLISKEFQEPRQLRFLIIIDNSSYMAGPKLEFALSSVVELMSVLRRFHHRYYILVHNEKTDYFIPMGNTTQSLTTLELTLLKTKPKGLEFSYKTLRDEIITKKLQDTVIILITDLEKPPENLRKEIMYLKSLWNQFFFFALYTPGFGSLAVTKVRETTQYSSDFVYYRRYAVEELLKLNYEKIIEEYKNIVNAAGGEFKLIETYETNFLLELAQILGRKQKQLQASQAMEIKIPEKISIKDLFKERETPYGKYPPLEIPTLTINKPWKKTLKGLDTQINTFSNLLETAENKETKGGNN